MWHEANISHSGHQEDFHDCIFTKLRQGCFWKFLQDMILWEIQDLF